MITFEEVHYSYRTRKRWFRREEIVTPVLQGVSLQVDSGEMFGLVGPNGSGKTTLTKLLVGVYPPDRGEILYQKLRPNLSRSNWSEKIGLVSGASTRLFSTIDLHEHIVLYKSLYRTFDSVWFERQIEEFQIQDKLHKRPTMISFGERIKFEIALTLACRPEVLILDEPTVGLDPMAISLVRNSIKAYLKAKGGCGILTSHNLKDITEICERGGFLQQGIVSDFFTSQNVNSELLEDRFREVYGSG